MTPAALIRFVKTIPRLLAEGLDFADDDDARRAVLTHMEAAKQQLEADDSALPFMPLAAAVREARYSVGAAGCPRSARLAGALRRAEDALVQLRDEQAARR